MSCEDLQGYVIGPAGESPPNYDGLPDTNFRLIFGKANIAVFFLQEFDLPAIKVAEVKRQTPFVDINEVGEKIVYDPFTITFLVDTKMKNFKQIYDWMKRMTVAGSRVGETDEVTLMINNAKMIRFTGCWPMSISGLNFVTNNNRVTYIKSTATFNYDWFDCLDVL
jgi:hypothetical protein